MKKKTILTQKNLDKSMEIYYKTKDFRDNYGHLDPSEINTKTWTRAQQMILLKTYFITGREERNLRFEDMKPIYDKNKPQRDSTEKEFELYEREFYNATGYLIKHGYLMFLEDKKDRRKKEYFLTPKGIGVAHSLRIWKAIKDNTFINKIITKELKSTSRRELMGFQIKNKDGTYTFHKRKLAKLLWKRINEKYDDLDFVEGEVDGLVPIKNEK